MISPERLPPRPIVRCPSDAPRSTVARLGFVAAVEPRRRTVIGSLKLTSEAFLMKDLLRINLGFFLIALSRRLRCTFL